MGQNVPLATAAGRKSLVTSSNVALERLFASVTSQMLLEGAFLVPSLATTIVFAHERFLSGVRPIVDYQVRRSKERFPTSSPRTGVGFFALVVSPAVIHQVSFGCKFSLTRRKGTIVICSWVHEF